MNKVIITYGTRAELIKLAPLIFLLKQEAFCETIMVSIKQHDFLLSQTEKVFGIQPDYTVEINRISKSLNELTYNIIKYLEPIIVKEEPKLVVVQGDTTSALASSLTASYAKVPIAYVEAGLRYIDGRKFFPEDLNRRLITQMCTYFYAPTSLGKQNLVSEGIAEKNIFVTGNTIVDSVKQCIKAKNIKIDKKNIAEDGKLILLTTHRRENIHDTQVKIFKGIKKFIEINSNIKVIYPVHPNPEIKNIAESILSNVKGVQLIEPLPYDEFLKLMIRCDCILSDSGGIQEESEVLKKPLVLLRDSSERYEEQAEYFVGASGSNIEKMLKLTKKALNKSNYSSDGMDFSCVYGDGNASRRIVEHIKQILS